MLQRFLWYNEIFWGYSAQYIKTKMAYRADFYFYIISDFLLQSMNLIFILVVFGHIDQIKGWSREEMLFIYGFFMVPFALYSGFFNHLFDVPEKYVMQGEFDRILIRPVNSLFQVVMETMRLELLAGVMPAVAIMIYAGRELGLEWHWWDFPVFFLMVIGAALIYGGIYIILASLGFWFEGRMGLMPMVYNLSNYGRYPTNVYKGAVRFILTWILPFAFVGFYPATILMHREEYYSYACLTPVVGLVFFIAAYFVWSSGIKRYISTGS